MPDPTNITEVAADSKSKTDGGNPSAKHDKTKQPVAEKVWDQASPVMRGVSDFVDNFERLGNALNPTPPFRRHKSRYKLAAALVPIFVAGFFTSPYMIIKGSGFAFGFGFFGDPIIQPGIAFLNKSVPVRLLNLQLLIPLQDVSPLEEIRRAPQLPSQGRPHQRATHNHPPSHRREQQGSPPPSP